MKITKHVRISDANHRYLKSVSAVGGRTITKLLDLACEAYRAANGEKKETSDTLSVVDARKAIKDAQKFIKGPDTAELVRILNRRYTEENSPIPSKPSAFQKV